MGFPILHTLLSILSTPASLARNHTCSTALNPLLLPHLRSRFTSPRTPSQTVVPGAFGHDRLLCPSPINVCVCDLLLVGTVDRFQGCFSEPCTWIGLIAHRPPKT